MDPSFNLYTNRPKKRHNTMEYRALTEYDDDKENARYETMEKETVAVNKINKDESEIQYGNIQKQVNENQSANGESDVGDLVNRLNCMNLGKKAQTVKPNRFNLNAWTTPLRKPKKMSKQTNILNSIENNYCFRKDANSSYSDNDQSNSSEFFYSLNQSYNVDGNDEKPDDVRTNNSLETDGDTTFNSYETCKENFEESLANEKCIEIKLEQTITSGTDEKETNEENYSDTNSDFTSSEKQCYSNGNYIVSELTVQNKSTEHITTHTMNSSDAIDMIVDEIHTTKIDECDNTICINKSEIAIFSYANFGRDNLPLSCNEVVSNKIERHCDAYQTFKSTSDDGDKSCNTSVEETVLKLNSSNNRDEMYQKNNTVESVDDYLREKSTSLTFDICTKEEKSFADNALKTDMSLATAIIGRKSTSLDIKEPLECIEKEDISSILNNELENDTIPLNFDKCDLSGKKKQPSEIVTIETSSLEKIEVKSIDVEPIFVSTNEFCGSFDTMSVDEFSMSFTPNVSCNVEAGLKLNEHKLFANVTETSEIEQVVDIHFNEVSRNIQSDISVVPEENMDENNHELEAVIQESTLSKYLSVQSFPSTDKLSNIFEIKSSLQDIRFEEHKHVNNPENIEIERTMIDECENVNKVVPHQELNSESIGLDVSDTDDQVLNKQLNITDSCTHLLSQIKGCSDSSHICAECILSDEDNNCKKNNFNNEEAVLDETYILENELTISDALTVHIESTRYSLPPNKITVQKENESLMDLCESLYSTENHSLKLYQDCENAEFAAQKENESLMDLCESLYTTKNHSSEFYQDCENSAPCDKTITNNEICNFVSENVSVSELYNLSFASLIPISTDDSEYTNNVLKLGTIMDHEMNLDCTTSIKMDQTVPFDVVESNYNSMLYKDESSKNITKVVDQLALSNKEAESILINSPTVLVAENENLIDGKTVTCTDIVDIECVTNQENVLTNEFCNSSFLSSVHNEVKETEFPICGTKIANEHVDPKIGSNLNDQLDIPMEKFSTDECSENDKETVFVFNSSIKPAIENNENCVNNTIGEDTRYLETDTSLKNSSPDASCDISFPLVTQTAFKEIESPVYSVKVTSKEANKKTDKKLNDQLDIMMETLSINECFEKDAEAVFVDNCSAMSVSDKTSTCVDFDIENVTNLENGLVNKICDFSVSSVDPTTSSEIESAGSNVKVTSEQVSTKFNDQLNIMRATLSTSECSEEVPEDVFASNSSIIVESNEDIFNEEALNTDNSINGVASLKNVSSNEEVSSALHTASKEIESSNYNENVTDNNIAKTCSVFSDQLKAPSDSECSENIEEAISGDDSSLISEIKGDKFRNDKTACMFITNSLSSPVVENDEITITGKNLTHVDTSDLENDQIERSASKENIPNCVITVTDEHVDPKISPRLNDSLKMEMDDTFQNTTNLKMVTSVRNDSINESCNFPVSSVMQTTSKEIEPSNCNENITTKHVNPELDNLPNSLFTECVNSVEDKQLISNLSGVQSLLTPSYNRQGRTIMDTSITENIRNDILMLARQKDIIAAPSLLDMSIDRFENLYVAGLSGSQTPHQQLRLKQKEKAEPLSEMDEEEFIDHKQSEDTAENASKAATLEVTQAQQVQTDTGTPKECESCQELTLKYEKLSSIACALYENVQRYEECLLEAENSIRLAENKYEMLKDHFTKLLVGYNEEFQNLKKENAMLKKKSK